MAQLSRKGYTGSMMQDYYAKSDDITHRVLFLMMIVYDDGNKMMLRLKMIHIHVTQASGYLTTLLKTCLYLHRRELSSRLNPA